MQEAFFILTSYFLPLLVTNFLGLLFFATIAAIVDIVVLHTMFSPGGGVAFIGFALVPLPFTLGLILRFLTLGLEKKFKLKRRYSVLLHVLPLVVVVALSA